MSHHSFDVRSTSFAIIKMCFLIVHKILNLSSFQTFSLAVDHKSRVNGVDAVDLITADAVDLHFVESCNETHE